MIRELISKATIIGESSTIVKYIEHFYEFEFFRYILNLSFSLIEEIRLSFKVYDESVVKPQDGLCETKVMQGNIKIPNSYVISIWEKTPYVLMHEICHMIEKECELDLQKDFLPIIHEDIKNLKNTNILVKDLVNQVIFKEIKHYCGLLTRSSELFARYFELFAWSQEVYPKDRQYLIRFADLEKLFVNTNNWVKNFLNPILIRKTHNHVKEYSNRTKLNNEIPIKHNWSSKTDRFNYKKIKPKL